MYNSISGKTREVNVKTQGTGTPTREEIEQRLLNSENMKRPDADSAKKNTAEAHGRFNDEQPAYIVEKSDRNDVQKYIELHKKAREKLEKNTLARVDRSIDAPAKDDVTRPPDETQRLTRMLVAARSTTEVQSVLSDAFNHMRDWQRLAAEGDKKAMAVVRKLSKLVSRGNRKIRDLHKEQVMLQRQKKAEKAQQEQIARRLREELKQAERLRKQRERRYLQERDNNNEYEPPEFGPSMAATEAKIRALAASMAALSANTSDNSSPGTDNSATIAGSDTEGADVSNGEAEEP